MRASHLKVSGIVQGVGFRPSVWQLAHELCLKGWVNNASDGVHIHIEGDAAAVDDFPSLLKQRAPAMSKISSICKLDASIEEYDTFEIRVSDGTEHVSTLVSPDIATCPDCLHELFDASDRRWHYPFINCTQCGPRFTIIDSLPYDRPRTSMKEFTMCDDCNDEYHDPANRRFHAQPDACFDCGPQLTWIDARSRNDAHDTESDDRGALFFESGAGNALKACDLVSSDVLIAKAVELLEGGGILAIKGLGGYHLACDARNASAVAMLRKRKRRPAKPFAIMVPTIDCARELCEVDTAEETLLCGTVRPIVLLRRRIDVHSCDVCDNVAGMLDELGVMLPYTPLQHLLLQSFGRPLVMTSGNMTEEPIVSSDAEAQDVLGPVADAFLGNDRAILSRYDDSVVRVVDEEVLMVRRARGYAPAPISLGDSSDIDDTSVILATGPEQKNTFCLVKGNQSFCSQHLGDLENAQTFEVWQDTVTLYQRLFELVPTQLACDMHPEYLSSKWAREQQDLNNAPLLQVQHHHAHIASVCAEHNITQHVIGVALDGTGYGDDGAIWGGEILLCNLCEYERMAHLKYLPLPGGASAIRHPNRMAAGALWACGLQDHPGVRGLKARMGEEQWTIVSQMIARGINCPPTSSTGRLLDAVAALSGVCTEATYDGEPAIELEAAIYAASNCLHENVGEDVSYAFELVGLKAPFTIDPTKALEAALQDIDCGCSPKTIARRFHEGLALAIVDICVRTAKANDVDIIALSGGVFMNRYLFTHIRDGLKQRGLRVIYNKELPANDGCIAYGQAAVARARLSRKDFGRHAVTE